MMRQMLQKFTVTAGRQNTDRRQPRVRMVALAMLGLAALTLALQAGRAPTSASAVVVATLYGGVNYTGGERPLYDGSAVSFEDTTWDNAADSIRLVPGAKVALYADPHLTGVCEVLTVSDPDLRNNRTGGNVSSLHVGANCGAPVLRLFADPNYTGANRVPDALVSSWDGKDLSRAGFENTITSIKVQAGQKIAVFEHQNYEGRCEVFTADDPDLRNNWIGNDTISSFRLNADCPITLYEHSDFGGRRWQVSRDVADVRDPVNGWPVFNDSVSSIRVPRGMMIAVYRDINFTGTCETFTADDLDLRNNRIGNDSISSFRVAVACP